MFHHMFEGHMAIPSPGLAGSPKPLPGVWPRSHANHYLEPQVTVGCQKVKILRGNNEC